MEQKFPDYEKKCLHRIPGTVAGMLGCDIDRPSLPQDLVPPGESKNVVLVLLDGFGFRHWESCFDDHDFLSALEEKGDVSKLTSVYPSETAAATTSIHTGLTPSDHGLIGWNMYFEDYGAYLKTLPFKTRNGENPTEIYGEGLQPEILFEGDSVYQLLAEEDVSSNVLLPEEIKGSEVSNISFKKAEQDGYFGLGDLSVKLKERLKSADGRNYFYVYIPIIDKISHYRGTDSEEYQAELSQVSRALKDLFIDKLSSEDVDDTKLIFTSDHGFTDVKNPKKENIDILEHEEVRDALDETSEGRKIMPFGSPRNTHLKLKQNKISEVKQFLEEELDAHIWTKEEALEKDLFGSDYAEGFGKRIGDIIICHNEFAVWHGEESEELNLTGFHGGLTKEEMEIPFITAKLEDLIE
jgi:predicted AlkP superfamily pyrophosphatase or phosphodiesterase